MDKYSKRSIAKLWIVGAVLMATCIATETFAQEAATADSISTTIIAATDQITVEEAIPDTLGELVNGLI